MELAQVEGAARIVEHDAVHHHLHVVALAAAQECGRETAVGAAPDDVRAGDLPQGFGDEADAGAAQVLPAENRDGRGHREARSGQPGGGHDDLDQAERIRGLLSGDGALGQTRTQQSEPESADGADGAMHEVMHGAVPSLEG
jgi:hypothetical protein